MMLLSGMIGAGEALVVSGHPDYAPVMWRDGGTLKGVGADLVKLIFTELGIKIEIRHVGPWKRVQDMGKHGKIDLILGIYHNEQRAAYLDYTEAYMIDPTSVVVRKGQGFPFKKWDDLKGIRGVVMHGESFGQAFDAFMAKELKVDVAYTSEICLRLLQAGKVDYFIWGYYPCMIKTRLLGVDSRVEALPVQVVEEGMHMAFSKKSRFRSLVPKVNAIILRMRQAGTLNALVKKNLDAYRSRPSKGGKEEDGE
jgi:polar amino acid transport system substrate-binding protein